MGISSRLVLLTGAVVAFGCGGDTPPPVNATTTESAVSVAQSPEVAVSPESSTELVREVFSFRGSGRDPFRSLLDPGQNLRPFKEDLRVLSIHYDASFPERSIAILRDTTMGERYEVRVRDELGRMRITEIRRGEVILTEENFGVPERVVLTLRRRGQGGN